MRSGGALVALESETGRVIGWSRYSAAFVGPDEIEIGWTFLGRAFWGGAYNAEMKRLMLTHAFRYVDRVVLRIGETNQRSRRAAEKIGATWETERRTASATPGGRDTLFYAITRAAYIARR
jgi:RimJ/RimL family protein N-acetyltransferase